MNPTASTDLWLAKPVPRYTSYPPAPAFHAGVGAREYADSAARIPADEAVSLYLHIPFCHELCLYCGCHTSVTKRPERVTQYGRVLHREIELVAGLWPQARRVSHLHFGGGTPNILSGADMDALFAALRRSFDFSHCREIAMELDPRAVTQEQAQTLAAVGVTRVSLGVQDFQPDVQRIVRREQPYELVAQVCGWLRDAEIRRLNFDLMYGLPLQTPATVAATARMVTVLAPDRIALFSYAHVPQLKKHQQALEDYGLPDKYALLAMDQAARDVLTAAGYVEIGMDHFARPDDPLAVALRNKTLRRNFQGYTDDAAAALFGMGASSIGQTPDGFFQNARDVRDWQTLVDSGLLATVRGIIASDEDRLRAAVIERLMCFLACDIPEGFDQELEALRLYEAAGIIAREGRSLRLTTPHRMAIRVIARVFDRYAGQGAVASRAA